MKKNVLFILFVIFLMGFVSSLNVETNDYNGKGIRYKINYSLFEAKNITARNVLCVNGNCFTGFNSSQMSNNGGILNILEDWLKSLFYTKSEVDTNITNANTSMKNYVDNGLNLKANLIGGNSFSGQQDFNGGWTSGGLSIINGNLFAQTGYFYNISSLQVNTLVTNGSLIPTVNNSFDIGNSTLKWKNGYFSGNFSANTLFVNADTGNVGIGTSSPSQKLDVNGSINIADGSSYMYNGVQFGRLAKGTDTYYANVVIGYNAGNTSSQRQTAIGAYAGQSNTGDSQTAIGYNAGVSNTGSQQTAIGYLAGYNNIGSSQTAVGISSGYSNTGNYVTTIGYGSGYSNSGIGQVAIGYNSGSRNSGAYQTALGYNTGQYNTGSYQAATGSYAGYYNTGSYQVAIGYNAGQYNDGNQNTAVGYGAFDAFTLDTSKTKTFDYTAVNASNEYINLPAHGLGSAGNYINMKFIQGTSAITGMTNNTIYKVKIIDANNIQIQYIDITDAGTGTGHTLTPQYIYSNSAALGYNAEPDASNQVMLGNTAITQVKTSGVIYSTSTGNNYFAGNVGIGTTSPTQKLDVNGNVNITGNLYGETIYEGGTSLTNKYYSITNPYSYYNTTTLTMSEIQNKGFYNTTQVDYNLTNYYVPYTGANKNIDLNGANITNTTYISLGQNKIYSHYIPGSTYEIVTQQNQQPGEVFTIYELRSPDTTTTESTLSLHNVKDGWDDWVYDLSFHNYAGDMKQVNVLSHFTGTNAGNFQWVSRYTDGTDYSMIDNPIMSLNGQTGTLSLGYGYYADNSALLSAKLSGYKDIPVAKFITDSSYENPAPALYVSDDTNYLYTGSLVQFALVNSVDNGTALNIINSGVGDTIRFESNPNGLNMRMNSSIFEIYNNPYSDINNGILMNNKTIFIGADSYKNWGLTEYNNSALAVYLNSLQAYDYGISVAGDEIPVAIRASSSGTSPGVGISTYGGTGIQARGTTIAGNFTILPYYYTYDSYGVYIKNYNCSDYSGAPYYCENQPYDIYAEEPAGISYFAGKIGIGTSSPTHKLELAAATTAAGGIGFGTDTELYRSAANTLALASGDSFNLVSGNLQVAGTNVITSGRIIQAADGTAAAPSFTFSADTDNGLYRPTTNELGITAGGTERMRITSTGKIGIGTTSPNAKLHVAGIGNTPGGNIHMGDDTQGTAKWTYLTGAHYNGVSNPQGISLIGSYATETGNNVVIGGQIYEARAATNIAFWTHETTTSTTGGTERMRITSTGNVGIGTKSPSYPLVVSNNVSGISIYSGANISATGYITRTSIYNKSEGSALDKIQDASYYLNNGKIDHSKFYGYVKYNTTEKDLSKPITTTKEILDENGTVKEITEVTYPDKEVVNEGVELGREIDLLRQAVYELKLENQQLKSSLCNLGAKEWC